MSRLPSRVASVLLRDPSARRFVASGAVNTALGWVLVRAFVVLYGTRPGAVGLAQASSYAIGMAVGYAMNRHWTFGGTHGTHARQIPRYVTAHLAALLTSSVLLQVGVTALGLPLTPCWIAVTGVTMVMNFTAQRYWVFAPR